MTEKLEEMHLDTQSIASRPRCSRGGGLIRQIED